MKKHNLIKESLVKHTTTKENILNNILTIIKEYDYLEAEKSRNSILILELLQRKKMYGYEIAKEIELKNQGALSFKEGELYPLLHNLEITGLLTSCWVDNSSDNTASRKYYKITAKGKNQLTQEKELSSKLNPFNNSTLEVLSWE